VGRGETGSESGASDASGEADVGAAAGALNAVEIRAAAADVGEVL
jgi:hypothetical protein